MSNRHGILNCIHESCISPNTREIFLHGYIGNAEEEPGIEYRMATQFVKNLLFLNKNSKQPIIVHMHTTGGNWHDSMAIYDTIRNISSPVVIIGYSTVNSMSSVILQSADLRLLMPNTEFMVHHGSLSVSSDYAISTYSQAQWDSEICNKMIDIYASECVNGKYFQERNMSKSKVKSFIKTKMEKKGDWFMSAEQAFEYGFCDELIRKDGKYPLESIISSKEYDISKH